MTAGWWFGIGALLGAVGLILPAWWRARRRSETPVSQQWRANQDYDRRGDRGT